MITFKEEHFSKIFDAEFMDLYRQHWKEIGVFDKKLVKLAPNWEIYRALGKNGNLKLFTIYDDIMLIGYQLFIIDVHPHYRETKMAESDLVYMLPQFRKGYTGYNFIKFCIDKLSNKVDMIIMNTKVDTSLDVIARRLKFKLIDYKFVLETKQWELQH